MYQNVHSDLEISWEKLDGKDKHSFVRVTWVTNMEKTFYLNQSKYQEVELWKQIKFYNDLCQDERDDQGHDDEPEDEMKLL